MSRAARSDLHSHSSLPSSPTSSSTASAATAAAAAGASSSSAGGAGGAGSKRKSYDASSLIETRARSARRRAAAATTTTTTSAANSTIKKVRFELDEVDATKEQQLVIDSVSALSDKQLSELLLDVKTEHQLQLHAVKSEPLPSTSSSPAAAAASAAATTATSSSPPVPLDAIAIVPLSSSSSSVAPPPTATTTATTVFEFNRLPSVARRRILMLLKDVAPQAPCVCWLWSQLLNDDAHDMCEYLVTRERRLQAAYARSVRQSELKREMLPMLIDWLVDVGEEFELRPVTLHTAVAYLRWHLALHQVRKSELQLLGATCLFVAAKFHEKEDDVPSVLDFVYMGDSAFTQQAMINAEVKLVHSLDFELQPVSALSFLHLYCDTLQVRPHTDAQVFWMAVHLLELAMLRTSTQRLRPSVAAAAALHIAIATRIGSALAIDVWDGSLYMLTGLTPSRAPMSNAVVSFYQLRLNPPSVPNHPLSAIAAKFQRPQYARVAAVPLPPQPPVP